MVGRTLAVAVSVGLVACSAAPVSLGELTWLRGRWQGEHARETWVLEGESLRARGEVHTGEGWQPAETLHLERARDPEGRPSWALVAQPRGAEPTRFVLVHHAIARGRWEAVFENPAHDHPQRIRYRREGDTLTATVSQLDGTRRAEFVFRRLGTEAPPH